MYVLEVLNSKAQGKRFKLRDEITVGSDAGNRIKVAAAEIHPRHCRLFLRNDRPYIEVSDDAAHIFVNGRDVLQSELQHNDQIKIGPLRLRMVDEAAVSNAKSRLDDLLAGVDEHEEVFDFAAEDLFFLTNKDPALRQVIAFTIPSRDRFIDQAQQFLARLARQSDADEMKVEAFMTCAKELILNAHRHGHQYDEDKTILIRYRDDGEALQLTIEDQGSGFDHAKILEKVRSLSPAEAARQRYQEGGFGGLGFQMISRMTDRIEYNDPGNIVTFRVNKDF